MLLQPDTRQGLSEGDLFTLQPYGQSKTDRYLIAVISMHHGSTGNVVFVRRGREAKALVQFDQSNDTLFLPVRLLLKRRQ